MLIGGRRSTQCDVSSWGEHRVKNLMVTKQRPQAMISADTGGHACQRSPDRICSSEQTNDQGAELSKGVNQLIRSLCNH